MKELIFEIDRCEIQPTEEERASGTLGEENLRQAKTALESFGFVVLHRLVDDSHLRVLRDRMLQDVASILARSEIPTQFSKGHLQQDPPPFREFLFRDVLVNPIVVQVTQSILGPHLHNSFYSGNTNLPGSQAQPVHADSGQLWPGLTVAHPAYSLVVNVPLVDMGLHNGSTEIWPGTHTDTTVFWQSGDIKVPSETLEERRRVCPPLQPEVPAGSVLIRDMRMWHRGVPNPSDQPRPMIAMIHNVAWFPTATLEFEEGSEDIFRDSALYTLTKFVPREQIDYLNRHGAYDLQPDLGKTEADERDPVDSAKA